MLYEPRLKLFGTLSMSSPCVLRRRGIDGPLNAVRAVALRRAEAWGCGG